MLCLMSAVALIGVKIWLVNLKALEMRMRKLLLDLYLAQILPEKSKKMILLKKLGFIDVLSAVRVSHILGIRLIKYISFLRMYISSRLFFCDKCKFQTSEYVINDTIRIKINFFIDTVLIYTLWALLFYFRLWQSNWWYDYSSTNRRFYRTKIQL